jgi:type II secretory pathway pseudopilin PulG
VESRGKNRMQPFRRKTHARMGGWTLTELLIAISIVTALSAGLITGVISMQKSFLASRHHVLAQSDQLLLLDYMGLDLRRALSVSASGSELTVTIPDYYSGDGTPRNPRIEGSQAVYGPSPTTLRYYKSGSTIYRSENGVATALARDVSDFQMTFENLGQSINVAISFQPRFQFSTRSAEDRRAATTTYTSTLLRNKR